MVVVAIDWTEPDKTAAADARQALLAYIHPYLVAMLSAMHVQT